MRKVSKVRKGTEAKWLILYQTETDVYVFPCASEFDGSATGDDWFPSVAEAEASCATSYGVFSQDWVEIAEPLPGCQHDCIEPIRVKGRNVGKPEWGTLERLEAGQWIQIQLQEPRPTIQSLIESQFSDCRDLR